jgi:hypothetical protein
MLRVFQIAEEYDEDTEERPPVIHVNLDPRLLLLLREVRYLNQPPFNIRLPPAAKELMRNTDSFELGVTATRLETIVSNYNSIMCTLTGFEKPMFERKLAQIDLVSVLKKLGNDSQLAAPFLFCFVFLLFLCLWSLSIVGPVLRVSFLPF